MADEIKIGLDGKPLFDMAQPVVRALNEIDRAVGRLSERNFNAITRAALALESQIKQSARTAVGSAGKISEDIAQAVEKGARKAQSKARRQGQSVGKEFAAGVEEEASKISVRVSAPRMLDRNGLGVSISGRGPGSASDVLAEVQRLTREAGLTSVEQLRDAQRQSDQTYRFRQNWYRAEQRSIEQQARDDQKQTDVTYRLRQNWHRAQQRDVERQAREDQRIADATFRARQAQARWETRQAAARNTALDRNAQFSAMSPAAQLSRASRVSSAIGAGMSDADATARYGSEAVNAARNLETFRQRAVDARNASRELSEANRELASRSRDVHSAFRGVAGAAGALFLTYGALVPLTTTFFATSAVREAISAYKDLEFQIKFVKALEEDGLGMSEGSARARLSATAADAGYNPVEAAKGMRLLAQSGLNAKQALEALPVVLKTATVGELSVATATETLTGAVHAFGLEMSEMGRVGDVLAKAGAISNTSVDRMAESLKQASSVAQQYHMNLEDVSTALVVLAKRNITGSSAGTSLVNLMRDISNPHGRAKKAADEIGFSAFDKNTGETKNLFDQILPELRQRLSSYTVEAQKRLIADLSNNRGEKLLVALLGATDSDLQDIRGKLQQATGFVNKANDELLDSVEGDLRRLRAAFTETLANAGESGSGPLRTALQSLRETVSSPEFQSALAALVTGVGQLARMLAGLASALTSPVTQLAAVAAAVLTSQSAIAALTAGVAGLATRLPFLASVFGAAATTAGGLAAGATAAGGAMGVLTGSAVMLLRIFAGFTVVGVAISLLTALSATLANRSGTDAAISAANDYTASLRRTNAQLSEQLRLKQLNEGAAPLAGSDAPRRAVELARAEVEAAKRALASQSVTTGGGAAMAYRTAAPQRARDAESRLQRAQSALGDAMQEEARQRTLQNQLAGRDGRRGGAWDPRSVGTVGSIAEQLQDKIGAGDKGYNPGNDRGAARAANQEYKNARKEIENLISANRRKEAELEEAGRLDENRLQQSYDRGVITYDRYQAQLTKLQAEKGTERVRLAEREQEAVQSALDKLRARAAKMTATGKTGVPEELANDIEAFEQKLQDSRTRLQKLRNDQEIQQGEALTKALKPASDILRDAGVDRAKRDADLESSIRKLELQSQGIELTEKERYIQEQLLGITGQRTKELEVARATMQRLVDIGVFSPEKLQSSPDTLAVYGSLQKYLGDLGASTEAAVSRVRKASDEAFESKRWQSYADRASSSIEGGVKGALVGALTGDTSAIEQLGQTLRKTTATALVDAFYEAFLGDDLKKLIREAMNQLRQSLTGANSGAGGAGGSGASGLLGAIGGLLGGGGGTGAMFSALNTANSVGMAGGDSLGTLINLMGWSKGGFSGGGYTGPGAKYSPAGLVHKGEYVINAASTRKLGLDFLNALNGYAEGGLVGLPSYGPAPQAAPLIPRLGLTGSTVHFAPVTDIRIDSRSDRAEVFAGVQKIVADSQKQYSEQLKRMRVIPS